MPRPRTGGFAYVHGMRAKATPLGLLLAQLKDGAVVPVRYSRRTLYGRYEQLMITTAAALLAVLGSMVLSGMAAKRPE